MANEDPLSEQAGICLRCACENPENRLSRFLLGQAGAMSATGVIAAVFLAGSNEREELLALARGAIAEQRSQCLSRGLFNADRCPEIVLQKTGTEG